MKRMTLVMQRTRLLVVLVGTLLPLAVSDPSLAGRRRGFTHEPIGQQTFASPQSNPIASDGSLVYVANTTSHTVDVIDASTNTVVATVAVGVEPVSVAVKPGGLEVWISNHVSDSVSVIDTNPVSPSFRKVVETVQSIDAAGVTQFDEPVGIAFREDGAEAYVALSSTNRVAVVDTATYQVTTLLDIRAQEPRALAVRNGRLYVAAFEGGNQSELSICPILFGDGQVGSQCSLGLVQLQTFVTNPNIPGAVKNIVIDPQVPDRDLFVFSTTSHQELDAVEGVGTLLYGLAVDAGDRVFVTQTDARNFVNGDHGLNLIHLDNRLFLNQISTADCTGGSCGPLSRLDLEPLPPAHPAPGFELATPFGLALTGDESTIVATAAGTHRVFTLNASTGALRDIVSVGAIPRGVAVVASGPTETAYVLNTLDNTVSVVDVTDPDAIQLTDTIPVGRDPTPDAVRRGRIAFNNAFASTSGTFSCGSCHPDGNTDQLLWRIGGACFLAGCDGNDEPRTTMPVRGLKNTLPLHWDGTLGDPFGGGNGAVGSGGNGGTDCSLADGDDHDCFVNLVEESLSGVMCDQNPATNPLGCPPGGNELTAQERDDMASFLTSVAYPPARSRRMDDRVSRFGDGVTVGEGPQAIEVSALQGFADFMMDQNGSGAGLSSCADSDAGCHALPLGASTNSPTLNGFDAPTMRGMTDRFLQFSLGPTNAEEILTAANTGLGVASPLEPPIRWDPNQGFREITTFGAAFAVFELVYGTRPLDTFQMFEEASTGHSGALGRQVTLNTATAALPETETILSDLEAADTRGVVNLRAVGLRHGANITLSYLGDQGRPVYKRGALELSHGQLLGEAQAGTLMVTLTAHLRQNAGGLQPLLSTAATGGNGVTGDPPIPVMSATGPADPPAFCVSGLDVGAAAGVLMDGQPEAGATLTPGGAPCNAGEIAVDLSTRPAPGAHLLQVQNPKGRLSNELPLCVGGANDCLCDGGGTPPCS